MKSRNDMTFELDDSYLLFTEYNHIDGASIHCPGLAVQFDRSDVTICDKNIEALEKMIAWLKGN